MKRWPGYQHGVNLGGWLSQCDHTKERYDSFITSEDIRTISGWGADHVRVPVDYNLIEAEDGTYIEEGFKYIDKAFIWCRNNKLNMILDLHKTYGFSFDEAHNERGFFENEDYQERFYRLWEEFSKRYGNVGDYLAFELLNEVTDKAYSDKWNEISRKCIERIRKIAPRVKILIGGYYNNSIEALPDLLPPYDENIIYNFHCYEPLIFTHQGAYWIPTMDTNFRVPVDAPYSKLAADTKEQISQVSIGFGSFDQSASLDVSYFERYFSEAVKIAEERGVALYCGEYGVIDNATQEDTVRWYEIISEAFEKYGIGRAAWSYKEMDFGLADPRLDDVRSKLIKLL